MANVAFDTLTASKDLQSAGIAVQQAEAIALVVKNSQGDLATRSDIDHFRTELKSDIDQLKSDIDHLRTEQKSDVLWLKWSMALMAAVMLGGFSIIISILLSIPSP